MILSVVLLSSCTAGNIEFNTDDPAGFWYGLWHGVISVIALLVHVFNDNVRVYEINNIGGWYDFGFLLGIIAVWGGSSHINCRTAAQRKRDMEWDDLGEQVEKKIMRKMREWAEEDGNEGQGEWEEIGQKVEQKLKRKIREWAEKD